MREEAEGTGLMAWVNRMLTDDTCLIPSFSGLDSLLGAREKGRFKYTFIIHDLFHQLLQFIEFCLRCGQGLRGGSGEANGREGRVGERRLINSVFYSNL